MGSLLAFVISARVMILPFAFLMWFLAWLMVYFPLPIRNAGARSLIQILLAIGVLGVWMVQRALYGSMIGTANVHSDHYFMAVTFVEDAVVLGIIFLVAHHRKKKRMRGNK